MNFCFLTAGESHGKKLTAIVEGIPAGLQLDFQKMASELKRRKLGYGRGSRQKIEDDQFEITAGVRHGITLGSPIAIEIHNQDFKNWQEEMSVEPIANFQSKKAVHTPRPGHGDYVGKIKFQHEDMRNVLERASARETAIRVAIGAICKQVLEALEIEVASRVLSIADIVDHADFTDLFQLNSLVDHKPLRAVDDHINEQMIEAIDLAKKNGDSLGGTFQVIAWGLPIGLGSYTQWYKKLDGKIAQAVMSLNAIKSVSIGLGADSATQSGSSVHDSLSLQDSSVIFQSNHAGGLLAGVTNGQPLIISAAMKPIATLMRPLDSVNLQTQTQTQAHVERADICAVPAASVIAESLVAIEIFRALSEKFGSDSMGELTDNLNRWKKCYEK